VILDMLLGEDPIDAEKVEPKKQETPLGLAKRFWMMEEYQYPIHERKTVAARIFISQLQNFLNVPDLPKSMTRMF